MKELITKKDTNLLDSFLDVSEANKAMVAIHEWEGGGSWGEENSLSLLFSSSSVSNVSDMAIYPMHAFFL